MKSSEQRVSIDQGSDREPIAIIGLGCRFPGASNADAYWELLEGGVDAITEVPKDRWDVEALYDPVPGVVGKISNRWGGFVEDVDQFDAAFFGITPREARAMDPQQRFVLEVAWEALEDAALIPSTLSGSRTSVFIGASTWDYNKIANTDVRYMEAHASTGTVLCVLANRLSYVLNLRGPSMAIDTACSSSLSAVHLACRSLRSMESSMALAGGVNLILSPETPIVLSQARMLSPDGRCKAFDEGANGYVRSDGCGVVVLKRASDARRDGDTILALIRGTAINQDGLSNGLSAPNGPAQQDVIKAALADAGVLPREISYVEAHGTGTALGDPIEVAALKAVLLQGRAPDETCGIGSVKTNIGHTEAAAGLAGLIKVVLAMRHKSIPPHLHLSSLNPLVSASIAGTPFYIPKEGRPWAVSKGPRLASVSSFGFGGANAHAILEEAKEDGPAAESLPPQGGGQAWLLPISAKGPKALRDAAEKAAAFLRKTPEESAPSFRDICFTAGSRRTQHGHRLAVAACSKGQAAGALEAFLRGEDGAGLVKHRGPEHTSKRRPKIVFVFPGQGSQWPGMGRRLLRDEPAFREAIERCEAAVRPHVGWSLSAQLTEGPGEEALLDPAVVQPLLFAMQVGLSAVWASWGVRPDCVVGHSLGEVAAAYVCGALSLEDAARVICVRSLLVGQTSGRGGMISVELSRFDAEDAIQKYDGRLSVAASNGPRTTIISGETAALSSFQRELLQRDVFVRAVKVEFASHSAQMDPLRPELLDRLSVVQPKAPAVRFASTAVLSEQTPVLDAGYWWTNLRQPVLLSERVAELLQGGYETYVEISPHPVLVASLKDTLTTATQGTPRWGVVGSLRREENERESLLESLGFLYSRGYPVDFKGLYPAGCRVVSLPAYPWQKERFWLTLEGQGQREGLPLSSPGAVEAPAGPLLERHVEASDRPGTHLWEMDLDLGRLVGLREHRVSGQVILPAAAYVDAALSSAAHSFGNAAWDLSQVRFTRPIELFEGQSTLLQLVLSSGEAGTISCSFSSRALGGAGPLGGVPERSAWVSHASAVLTSRAGERAVSRVSTAEVRERCTERLSGDAFYQRLVGRGVEYGPAYRWIDEVWRRDGEAIASLAPSVVERALKHRGMGHPSPFDAAIQALGGAVRESDMEGATYVPVEIRSLRPPPDGASWVLAHAVVRHDSGVDVEGDVCLLDEAGCVLGEAEGIRLRRIRSRRAPTVGDGCLFELTWQKDTSPSVPARRGTWLIFTDEGGTGVALCKRLRAGGQECVLVKKGAGYLRADDDLYTISPDRASDLTRLLRDAFDREAPAGVVYLWGLPADRPGELSPEALLGAQHEGCGSVLHLVQASVKAEWPEQPRIWIVTRGASAIGAYAGVDVAHASLWGLGLTIARELPEFQCTLIDLDPEGESDGEALHEEVIRGGGEERIALRRGERHVARLGPFVAQAAGEGQGFGGGAEANEAASGGRGRALGQLSDIRADATYVLSGGVGELGLLVARWLVDRGGRNVLLLGRRPPTEAAARAISALTERGARVQAVALDVADIQALERLFDDIRTQFPPLRGIFHLAASLEDGTLLNLSASHFSGPVFASKALGAYNLHLLTRKMELDLFVLFSSAASIFGAPGVANYASANALLDALAQHRRAVGLPAVSINWGPWSGKGFAAGANREGRLSAQGMAGLSPDEGLALLEEILRSGASNVMAAKLGARPALRGPLARLFERLEPIEQVERVDDPRRQASRKGKGRAVSDILQAEEGQRLSLIEIFLCDELARITGLEAGRIPHHETFQSLGMDSLLVLELRNVIEADFGIYLSAVAVLNYPSVDRLARYLLTKVSPSSSFNDPSEERSLAGRHGRGEAQGGGTAKEDQAFGVEDVRGRWLVRFATRPDARLRLFCFPPAGAGASVFRSWASALPSWVDVCAVQLPGREERSCERSCDDFRLLLDALMQGPFGELDRPFALLGCSLGALIAYEAALRIHHERGVWPSRFFAVAFQHPSAVRDQKSGVSERQWFELLIPEELRQNSPTTEELLPVLRADIKLGFSWTAEGDPPLGCSISAFAGSHDPIAGPSLEGWARYTGGRFIHRVIPGGHRFAQTHEEDFLPLLRQDIESLDAELHR